MATIDDQINDFLRDASFRVAELTIDIDAKKRSDKSFKVEAELRAELTTFMDLLFDTINNIKDDYTFLKTDWPDREITLEMEYLRDRTGMSEIPYITFTNYSPNILVQITGGNGGSGSTTLPAGALNQIITYDISGNAIAVDFPTAGGMFTSETIDQYFG
jgi:hypothetical protein